jgi:nucleoid DNA-binding protein
MHVSNRELVKRVAERTALPKKVISGVLTGITEELQTAMVLGDTVTIQGLGRFKRSIFHSGNQKAPNGRLINRFVNRVYFRAGKALRRVILKSTEIFDAAQERNV